MRRFTIVNNDGVMVFEAAGKRLAMLVEQQRLDDAKSDLEELLRPMLDAGIDTLVLGCTHYPFLSEQIAAVTGPGVRLVDPAPAVARQVQRVLGGAGMLNGAGGATTYLTSLDAGRFEEQLRSLLGVAVAATSVGIENQGTRPDPAD